MSLMHRPGSARSRWTTVNIAEAMPGVQPPLAWDVWGDQVEIASRAAWADIGALSRSEVRCPDAVDERLMTLFYGRPALNVAELRELADRSPGTSGHGFETQYLGNRDAEPSDARPDLRALGRMVTRAPSGAIRFPGRLRGLNAELHSWWLEQTRTLPGADLGTATVAYQRAKQRFRDAWRAHGFGTLIAQGLYEQVEQLASHGQDPAMVSRLLTASGELREARMLTELQAVAHDGADLADFLARYGFHGPNEGNLAEPPWREDPAPLRRTITQYRDAPRPVPPTDEQRGRAHAAALAELRAGLPLPQRPTAAWTVTQARRFLGLRELGKSGFLMAIDVARCAARTVGASLVETGRIDQAGDVFFLLPTEFSGRGSLRAAVDERRAEWLSYRDHRLPRLWTGIPEPVTAEVATGVLRGAGIGAAPVEGPARVILDPAHCEDLRHGEILVCPFTDPSWTPVFAVAAGLVIDSGGPMSHGAIIARELGLPCVIGTGNGTVSITTGDRTRIDPIAGTVQTSGRTATTS